MEGDHRGSSDVLPEQDRWRVRICNADGAVLGAGILLGTRQVLTCAHVLLSNDPNTNDNSDDPGTNTVPSINVVIDFVGLHKVPSAKARVAVDGWVPPDDDKGGDIALLELEEPQSIGSTTPLRRLPASRDRAVYTCGFPKDLEGGMWVDATLSGGCGPGGECVQMNETHPGRQMRPGFSGAPVFDKMTHSMIGMVVGKFNDPDAGIAHMLPVETIVRHLSQVEEWVIGPKATDPTLMWNLLLQEVNGLQEVDDDLARKIVSWIERRRDR